MAKTRKKTIAQWVEKVLLWVSTFGVSALLMYWLKDPQSDWIGWFTLVAGVLGALASIVLFHTPTQEKLINWMWRISKPNR